MKNIFAIITVLIFITGCSPKNYFEPQKVTEGLNLDYVSLPSDITSINRVGATLENGQIITRDGISKFKLPEGFDFINVSDSGKILATNHKDKLLVGNEELNIDNVVIAASLKGNLLALLYSNNTMELVDLDTKKTLFKDYQSISLANDTRVANPEFMGDLVLFPTLNGKIVIVSSKTNEAIKEIMVDPDGQFNNIIYLDIIDNLQTMIVASPNRVVSVSPEQVVTKKYELRDILVHDKDVYIATIDGNIMKLTSNLDLVAKSKFKYARFFALAYSSGLYAIESEGYIIKLNDDLTSNSVYKYDFNNDEHLVVIGNKIYNEDEITLP